MYDNQGPVIGLKRRIVRVRRPPLTKHDTDNSNSNSNSMGFEDLKKMKVRDVRVELSKRGLSADGLKAELVHRLQKHLDEEESDLVDASPRKEDTETPLMPQKLPVVSPSSGGEDVIKVLISSPGGEAISRYKPQVVSVSSDGGEGTSLRKPTIVAVFNPDDQFGFVYSYNNPNQVQEFIARNVPRHQVEYLASAINHYSSRESFTASNRYVDNGQTVGKQNHQYNLYFISRFIDEDEKNRLSVTHTIRNKRHDARLVEIIPLLDYEEPKQWGSRPSAPIGRDDLVVSILKVWSGNLNQFYLYIDGDTRNESADNMKHIDLAASLQHVDDWEVSWKNGLTPEQYNYVREHTDYFSKLGAVLYRMKPTCGHCGFTEGANAKKLMKCGRCHNAFYCCREHQKREWPRHKESCDIFAAMFNTNSFHVGSQGCSSNCVMNDTAGASMVDTSSMNNMSGNPKNSTTNNDMNSFLCISGASVGTWRTDKDNTLYRREMMYRIFRILKKDGTGSLFTNWLNRLPALSNQLEFDLYQNAPSFEAYFDMRTLNGRLQHTIADIFPISYLSLAEEYYV